MQSRFWPLAVLATFAAAGIGWAVLRPGEAKPPARGDRVQPVAVATVQQRDIALIVPAIGTIAASNTAVVKAKVEGELKALHFQEGQVVQAGALLAELDRRPFEIALAQAEGQLARDRAQWQNAALDLARFRDLLGKDGISKQQVDTQAALVQQLQGTVQMSQAAVDNATLQLSYTRIVAPIGGRLGLKQVDLGNVVKPADALGLVTIAQTRPAQVVFAVPEDRLGALQARLEAGEPLQVEAWDRAQKQRLATGRLVSTDNGIDATTGTIKLKAAFANADGSLTPNQFVNVRLRLGTVKDTLAVPAAAVLRNGDGSFVYVVDRAARTVSTQPVQPGAADGDWVAVQGALQAGQTVVTDGTDRIRDGAKVAVIQPASEPATAVAQDDTPRPHRRRPAP